MVHAEFILEIAVIYQEGGGCTSFLKRLSGLGRLALFLILCSVSGYNYFVNVSIVHWFRTQIIWHLFLLWKMLKASSPAIISYMKNLTGVEVLHEDSRNEVGAIKNSKYDLFLVMSK